MERVNSPLEINDIWPENYSTNSVQKVWAAKFAARHPNIAVLDLSSFKCGHDAPTYGLIDRVLAASPTPHSTLHDIDANKPSGSIQIRVKTYAHTLKRREEQLQDLAERKSVLKNNLIEKQRELLVSKWPEKHSQVIPFTLAKTEPAIVSETAPAVEIPVVWMKQPEQNSSGCQSCSNTGCSQHEAKEMPDEFITIKQKR